MNTENQRNPSKHSTFGYFPKREGHPKCNVAIHPIPPPNGCGKGGIMNYQYTRPQISYFRSENQCQMHTTARSAEIDDIFIYRTNCIYRTHQLAFIW